MKIDLDKIEALAKAATPGPWDWKYDGRYLGSENCCVLHEDTSFEDELDESDRASLQIDKIFIAALDPTTVQEWVKYTRELEAALIQAAQYLREGKAKFAPNTTNSFVDDFIEKWGKV